MILANDITLRFIIMEYDNIGNGESEGKINPWLVLQSPLAVWREKTKSF